MKKKTNNKFSNIFLPISVAFFNIILIFYPNEIISASKDGISLWFNNVFPSLLPFLIGTNILIGLGVVNFIGTILEPIMISLFGVPGIGGFSLVCGLTSGYPMGAKITSELREKKLITKNEAQRLISFTNNSGPLFVVGAVGVTMFKNANIGYFILLIHYLGALVTGLLFKYYNYEKPKFYPKDNRGLVSRAYKSMNVARNADGRKFTVVFSDSIKNSMETILIVGGFIILFSVIGKIFSFSNLITYIDTLFLKLTNININNKIFEGFIFGLIEITNGTKLLADNEPSLIVILLASFIISFGGFSIHSQALSFLTKTDINFFLYIIAKFLHAIFTFLIGIILFPFFNLNPNETSEVFFAHDYGFEFLNKLVFSSWSFIFSIFIVFIFMFIFNFYSSLTKK